MKKKNLAAVAVLVAFSGLVLPASAESRFGFKLGGGLAYIGGGDINTGQQGYFDYLHDAFKYVLGMDASGEYKPVHAGAGFDGEIFYQVTPRFALGFGLGYMAMARESSMILTESPMVSHTLVWTPKVKVVPLTLNVHYFVPLGDRLKLVLTAGAGWYFARFDREELDDEESRLLETTGGGFGAHGGLGFELELSRSFFLTLDILGRYARVSEMSGAYDDEPNVEGTLWFFNADVSIFHLDEYPLMGWEEGAPSGGGIGISNLRKAVLDLSGFSAVFGILIRI